MVTSIFQASKCKVHGMHQRYTGSWSTGLFLEVHAIIIMLVDRSIYIVQELCESRGGRPGLSVLTSLLVSVDVKLY